MTQLSIHDVTAIELAASYVENSNSRTIRITSRTLDGAEQTLDLVVYGKTEAADALPRAADFYAVRRGPEDQL